MPLAHIKDMPVHAHDLVDLNFLGSVVRIVIWKEEKACPW